MCGLDWMQWNGLILTLGLSDLKRFSECRVRTGKLSTFVNFPLKDLDLREFASNNCSKSCSVLDCITGVPLCVCIMLQVCCVWLFFVYLQLTRCIICTLCRITPGRLWVDITQRTAAVPVQESGTPTMTPGTYAWLQKMLKEVIYKRVL